MWASTATCSGFRLPGQSLPFPLLRRRSRIAAGPRQGRAAVSASELPRAVGKPDVTHPVVLKAPTGNLIKQRLVAGSRSVRTGTSARTAKCPSARTGSMEPRAKHRRA